MKKTVSMFVLILAAVAGMGQSESSCDSKSSDQIQRQQQETMLAEGTAQVGMPAIKNYRERKLMKDVLEKRDQEGLVTYTYLFSELRGCLVPFGTTVGYPIPYSTQFTNPEKPVYSQGVATMPQADPNGLFSPSSAEGTWSVMKDPHGTTTGIVYSEPRLIAMPFKADESTICSKQ